MKLFSEANKLLAIFSLALGLSACGGKTKSAENVGVVSKEDLVQRVTVSGNIVPWRKSLIGAPYQGYVQKLFVKVGDRVKEGDPIVSIKPLLQTVGEQVYPIRAPLSGTVVQILKLEGEAVDQSTATNKDNALVRIDDLSRLVVQTNVPEMDIEKIHEGQEGVIKASALVGRAYKGSIQTIFRAAKENQGWDAARVEFPVLIEILDKDEKLRPGMSVLVDIISKKAPSALSLRLEYIENQGDEFMVTMESGERRKVEVGMQNEEAAQIVSGLKEGDRVRQVDFLALGKGGGKGRPGKNGPGGGGRGRGGRG